MKRLFQTIGVAFIVAGFFNAYLDWLLTPAPTMPIVLPKIPVIASYSPVEAVEHKEAIKLSIREPRRVYEGVSLPYELINYVIDKCEEYDVEPELAFAIMKSESQGLWVEGDWSDELNRYRSVGYFQIRDVNWGRLYDAYGIDAQTRTGNIDAGVVMIKELCDKYGKKDICQIVTSYKCGESRGEELVNAGIILDAVDAVMMDYAEYKEESK